MFSANGEYLFNDHYEGVQVWRVEDGEEMASLEAENVWYLAVSKDDNWIVVVSFQDVIV